MKMKGQKISIVYLCILSVIVIALSLFFLNQKSGYYIDEGMTMYLANGSYNGAVTTASDYSFFDFIQEFVWRGDIPKTLVNIKDMVGQLLGSGNYSTEETVEWYDAARSLLQGNFQWVTSEELVKQITAETGNRFNYVQVYLNQVMDVHPPLYYILAHTVFSLFQGRFSNGFLFSINIIFLLMTVWMLYKLAMRLFHNEWSALLTVTLYGISQSFFSCVLYFRMYAVLSFFVIATLYMHLVACEGQLLRNRKVRALLITTLIMGSWTHYYYYIFLFPTAIITVWWLAKKYGRKDVLCYVKNVLVSAGISLVIWPFSLYHILFSYRGTEAVDSLIHRGFVKSFGEYIRIILSEVMSSNGLLGIVVAGIIIIAVVTWTKKEKKIPVEGRLVVIPILFYLLMMAKITPIQSDRYIFCIIPLLCLCVVWGVITVCILLHKDHKVACVIVGIFIICNVITGIRPNYLYLEQKNLQLGIEKDNTLNCLMVMDDDASAYAYVPYLLDFNEILAIGYGDIDKLEEVVAKDRDFPVVLYMPEYFEADTLSVKVAEKLDMNKIECIESDFAGVKAYLLEK